MLDWGLNASGLVKNPFSTVTGLDDIRDFPLPLNACLPIDFSLRENTLYDLTQEGNPP
jgi:hypothetical protein